MRWKTEPGGHPHGVRPYGSLLLSSNAKDARGPGLGTMTVLPDELLMDTLLPNLPLWALGRLAQCSGFLYVLVYHDESWRLRLREDFGPAATWTWTAGTWRQTYRDEHLRRKGLHPGATEAPIRVGGVFSDDLFRPHYLSKLVLGQFVGPGNIPRRSAKEMTVSQFVDEFARPGRPVIITDLVDQWPCRTKWTKEWLLEQFGGDMMRAEAFDLPLATYLDYSARLPPSSDSPLYLFSAAFPPSLKEDFSHPPYFSPDLLDLLPPAVRPLNTWLVVGPRRSASTFHVDPNGTSAFNALVRGRKAWWFFPPDRAPPGVYKSEDGGEVTAPRTLLEWLTDFLEGARADPGSGMAEGVCEEGECVYVPGGWWHAVLNLEDSVALTRNFCAPPDLFGVLEFFRSRHAHVSGVAALDEEDSTGEMTRGNNVYGGCTVSSKVDMYEEFGRVLREKEPELWRAWEEHERAREAGKGEKRKAAEGLWRSLGKVARAEEGNGVQDTAAGALTGGFSFGFVADGDEGEEQ
ncbi:hypothetical protein DFJ74DRAFT_631982 [Hyaloraphidium curvatum]|nr:hypothetical protein DFJ74DRAFT_631982 [Hyaloraphidium curvatum]